MSWKYFVCLYMCALHLSKNTTKGGGKKEGGKQERKREQEKDHSEETRVEGREKSECHGAAQAHMLPRPMRMWGPAGKLRLGGVVPVWGTTGQARQGAVAQQGRSVGEVWRNTCGPQHASLLMSGLGAAAAARAGACCNQAPATSWKVCSCLCFPYLGASLRLMRTHLHCKLAPVEDKPTRTSC